MSLASVLLAALLSGAIPSAAHSASDAPVPTTAEAAQANSALFVALVVNGVETPDLVSVEQRGARFIVAPDALRRAGLSVPGAAPVDVTALPGVAARYDQEQQRLILDVPLALLPTRRIAGTPLAWTPPVVSTGAVLNYDLFAQNSGGETFASLLSEQRAFGPWGTIANTAVWRSGGGGIGQGVIRYDTTYRYVDEGRALSAAAGDVISGALTWSRAVRIGGVRLTRSFETRPDLITVPLPDFAGQAALPSGVDLFINDYHQQHNDVSPGRFVLDQVPVVNGAGEARIVTTDAVGRQIATVIPFYVAPELLRPGLTDFSIDAGALRRDYGIKSFSYGRGIVSGAVRHGLTDRLTIEAHGEGADDLLLAGAGAVWSPGRIGAVHGSLAANRREGRQGTRLTVGYNYVGRSFSAGIERVSQSRDFADLGSFDLAKWNGRQSNLRATVSTRLATLGSLGLGYIDARARDGARARIASASMSLPVGTRSSLFAAADYDFTRRGLSAQLRFVMPFGRNTVASAGIAHTPDGATRIQADAASAVPTDGGLGWSASGAYGSRGDFVGQANATYRTRTVTLEAGAARAPATSSVYASASGSMVLLGGKPYLANELPSAFAVVTTGMPGVPVFYENQPVGRTARDGRLFVPRVVAYHPGQFSIDIADMPAVAQAPVMSQRVAFREGTGGVVALTVSAVHSAVVKLVDAAGNVIPAGTPVMIAGAAPTVVGWDGVVLIEGKSGAVTLTVPRVGGGSCTGSVSIPVDLAAAANLGAVTCR
ncbi:fimbria/pilus outer membrane usher protein [uncultured Sphingomonas sp.]|uniref:fimbria/pilus outer membrane usher protein n=1 Tax=uncultured Sphingomonas sp. TaxID=158754 RepID=UPI0025D04261|nr:fimbria/pilus outer membrane usher protein [uncultured Sphingomonas sp.]